MCFIYLCKTYIKIIVLLYVTQMLFSEENNSFQIKQSIKDTA